MKLRPLKDKVYVKRFKVNYQNDAVLLSERHVEFNCTGVISAISSQSDLAKEGFGLGHHVVFHQQYRGKVLDKENQELLMLNDADVIAKYITTPDGEVIVRPRKGFVFGELEREEKVGLIIIPGQVQHKKVNSYLHIVSIPLDNKFQNELIEGSTILLPKGWNVNRLTSKFEMGGKTFLFANIKLITNKVVKIKEKVVSKFAI